MLILSLLTLFVIQMLGVMLPGPDFFMVLRSSLKYGHKSGVIVALGIASGVLSYVLLTVLFLDYLNTTFMIIVHWIGFFGGCYLLYMAYKCATASAQPLDLEQTNNEIRLSKKHLYTTGLFCNLSNPKVIIFFLSFLPIFVMKSSKLWYLCAIVVIMFLSTFLWFTLVAFLMGSRRVRAIFMKYMAALERIFAVILVCFAAALFYAFFSGVAL
ncbi:MAG: LysE family translocator [Francisellaceae bacterium]